MCRPHERTPHTRGTAVAAGAVEGPVLFLKISVTLAAIEVWKEEEGERGARDRSQSGCGTFSGEGRTTYVRALLSIICIEADLHECYVICCWNVFPLSEQGTILFLLLFSFFCSLKCI